MFFRHSYIKESVDNLQKWYAEVDRYVDAKNLPKIILANKWDLAADKTLEQKITETLRVGEHLGKRTPRFHKSDFLLATQWKCKLMKTSAKTSENVNEAFESLIRSCIEKASGTSTFNGNNSSTVSLTPTTQPKKKCIL